jgi:uncharacterized cupredoxin-like copper-binding protein
MNTQTLRFYVGAALAALIAGCSANSGPQTSAPVPSITSAPTVSLAISPTTLGVGQSATASWSTSNATACISSGAWSGSTSLGSTGVAIGPFKTAGTYTYGMTCTGSGGSAAASQTVTVGAVPAPTIVLNLIPSSITPGSASLLVWSTTNAQSCVGSSGTGSDGWQGSQPTINAAGFNTGKIDTTGQVIYDLTCLGPGGSTQATRILSVSPTAPTSLPVITFTAQPTLIQPGQSTTLTWNAANATACVASGGTASVSWSGSQPLTSAGMTLGPIDTAGTYSLTLTCAGAGGSAAKDVVIVVSPTTVPPAVTVDVDVSPTQVVAGSSANLAWTSSNATACSASGSWSGSEPLLGTEVSTGTLTTAAVYSYTLTCTGPGGSATGTASLQVNPAAAVVTNLAATPSTIQTGQSVMLSWGTTGAASCAASAGTGAWAGVQPTTSTGTAIGPINTAGTYVFTLECTGPGGTSAPRSVTVTVTNPTPPAAAVVSFAANPSTIQVGQSVSLTWTTTNATACTASGGAGSWGGSVGAASVGTSTGPINTAGTYTFTLTCSGPGGVGAPNSVAVNVTGATPGPVIISLFTAVPSTLQVGQSASLAWTTIGATACAASGGTGSDGWTGAVPTSSLATSTGAINVAGSYTYTLTCTGGGANATNSVVVNVINAPPAPASIVAFAAVPSTVLTGQTSLFTWSTTSATSCTASGATAGGTWVGAVPTMSLGTPIGPLNVAGNYVFTLTCTGPGGVSSPASVTVDVNNAAPAAIVTSLTAIPLIIQSGQSTTLAWSSLNATSCAATGGDGADGWNGSVGTSSTGLSVGPESTGVVNFTLTCTGPGGASAPYTVAVTVTATPPPAAILAFTATPTSIQTGGSILLTWVSANATGCTATGGTGSDGWNGAEPTTSIGTSTGSINTAGSYTYTLTCTGPGGASAASSVNVTVTSLPPPPSVVTLAALPDTLLTGQSTLISWTTAAASACTASGGTGADGWGGTVGVASLGTLVGPINTAGTYAYTLTCTGPGGTSAPASINVTVDSTPVPATILTFSALPTTLQAGQAASLEWTTLNATSCTASGGSGSDGWAGTRGPVSLGTSTGPLAVGTYTYTLMCTGSGGSSAPLSVTVTVTAPAQAPPTVILAANGANPAQIAPGASVTLTWATTNATGCTASGGTGSDGWSGSQPTLSLGTVIGPIATPGTYTYSLSCTGPGGTGTASVQVTVIASASYDCGLPSLATAALVAPAASVTTSKAGLCLLDCTVANPGNVIDSIQSNYATMFIPLGLAGSVSLDVTDTATFPAGRQVGFVISNGTNVLNLALLGGISVQTLAGGTVQETATVGNLLTLQAAGVLSVDPDAGFAGFTTTKPFDSVQLVAGSLVSVASNIKVYNACVSMQ